MASEDESSADEAAMRDKEFFASQRLKEELSEDEFLVDGEFIKASAVPSLSLAAQEADYNIKVYVASCSRKYGLGSWCVYDSLRVLCYTSGGPVQ